MPTAPSLADKLELHKPYSFTPNDDFLYALLALAHTRGTICQRVTIGLAATDEDLLVCQLDIGSQSTPDSEGINFRGTVKTWDGRVTYHCRIHFDVEARRAHVLLLSLISPTEEIDN